MKTLDRRSFIKFTAFFCATFVLIQQNINTNKLFDSSFKKEKINVNGYFNSVGMKINLPYNLSSTYLDIDNFK